MEHWLEREMAQWVHHEGSTTTTRGPVSRQSKHRKCANNRFVPRLIRRVLKVSVCVGGGGGGGGNGGGEWGGGGEAELFTYPYPLKVQALDQRLLFRLYTH